MIKLMPEQIIDSDAIAEGAKFVFNEAGTGKTLTALEACKKLKVAGGVVVAPTIALKMWEDEITNWLGQPVQRVKTGKDKLDFNAKWFVLSFDIATKAIGSAIRQHLFAEASTSGGNYAGIVDEAHYLKNATAKRTRAVYGPSLDGRGGLLGSVTHPMILTGTPILRHNDDMFTHLKFCYPKVLAAYGVDTLSAFKEQFTVQQLRQFHPRQRPTYVVTASRNNAALGDMLTTQCGMIRRTFADMEASLPELLLREVYTPVGKLSASIGALTMQQILEALAQDDPIIMTAWRELGLAKAASAVEYIAGQPHAVVAGVWHTELGDILEKELRGRKKIVARVTGGTPAPMREKIRENFNAGKIDVLIGQIRAMNVSWNLQAHGHHVVMVEDHWSPGIVEQFYKRVYRMGQRHPVQLDFLKSDHDIDSAITSSRTNKQVSHYQVLDQ